MGKLFSGIPSKFISAAIAGMLFLGGAICARADVTSTPALGSNVTLYVTADGSGPFTYQWKKKIGSSLSYVDIAGANGPTYLLSNIQVTDAGSYSVVVTNPLGSVTSDIATFGFTGIAPVIVTQPAAAPSVAPGGTITFTVVATGGPIPTSFQWKKGGVNLTNGGSVSGATTTALTLTGVTVTDAGSYTVVVDNGVTPAATSIASVLTVGATAPFFTTQPTPTQTVTAGTSVSFTAAASGAPAPTYQWKRNGLNLSNGGNVSGATSATLTLNPVALTDAGTYTVIADNTVAPPATSNNAVLVVNGIAPSISASPSSQSVLVGNSVTFSVTASGTAPLSYQWQKGGINISGATGSSYSISSVQVGDAGSYTVVVTNGTGSVTSAGATLTVTTTPPPSITAQPSPTTVVSGRNASFHVTATGSTGYQWQSSSDGGITWTAVANNSTFSGATTSTLTATGASQSLNNLLFRALAINVGGTTISVPISFNVLPPVLVSPTDVVTSSDGRILVSDASTNVIQSIASDGLATVLAGVEGVPGSQNGDTTNSLFRQPAGIALLFGSVFVADSGNSLIRKISSSNQITSIAGSEANQAYRDANGTSAWFNLPVGIVGDSSGNLYIADTGNSVIRKFSANGDVSTLAGTAGSRGSANGTGSAARFNQPTGLAIDAAGNLYVADTLNQIIRQITPGGVVTTLAGVPGVAGTDDGPASNALFNRPWGIALDSANNLFVSDSGNSTIRRISAARNVTTFAGLPTVSGLQDGTGLNALFNQPMGLRFDSSGTLYVVDNGNAAIRRVSTAGAVTTMAIRRSSTAPTTPATPPPPTTPTTPAVQPASRGGGGGAPSWWFLVALLTAGAIRCRQSVVRWKF